MARSADLGDDVFGLRVPGEGLQFAADPGQTLISFTAAPGSPSAQALQFLASWAAAPQEVAAHDREVERGEPERLDDGRST